MDPDFIWIEDAAKEYDRSRSWLDGQVDQGKLSIVNIPGDRRKYLRRSQLNKLLRPQEEWRGPASEDRKQA